MTVQDPIPTPDGPGPVSEATMTQLLMQVGPELLGYIESKTPPAFKSFTGPEDIFQETCIHAYRSRETFRMIESDSFRQWIWRIAQNVLVDILRAGYAGKRYAGKTQVSAESQIALLSNVYGIKPAREDTPSRIAARREAVVKVQVALSSLPDDQRQAMILHDLNQVSMSEVATSMNRSLDSIRGLLDRGRRKLATVLGDPAQFFSRIDPRDEMEGKR